MKKVLTVFGVVACMFIMICGITTNSNITTYAKNAIAIDTNLLETTGGNIWKIDGDLVVGKTYRVFFNNNNTAGNIYDDIIVNVK